MGEAEWAALSERERQAKLMQLKLQEKKLRQEGRLDEAAVLLGQLQDSDAGTWYKYNGDGLISAKDIQWNPSGKARDVSLKLQSVVHFHAPFFTNHLYFNPHDRLPLLKGHHLMWPL